MAQKAGSKRLGRRGLPHILARQRRCHVTRLIAALQSAADGHCQQATTRMPCNVAQQGRDLCHAHTGPHGVMYQHPVVVSRLVLQRLQRIEY